MPQWRRIAGDATASGAEFDNLCKCCERITMVMSDRLFKILVSLQHTDDYMTALKN